MLMKNKGHTQEVIKMRKTNIGKFESAFNIKAEAN